MSNNTITIKTNGPLIIEGDFKIKNVDGSVIVPNKKVYLCGCGKSKNKPFCDGEHNK